jgi:hypothetical protein
MTDPTNAQSQARKEPPRSTATMPFWVKVFLITAAVLVVLVVALMLVSGGQHGPGRHLSSSAWTGSLPQASLPHGPISWRR